MRPFVLLVASVAALGGLLFGYDTGVISGAILFITKDFALPTHMQEFTISVVLLGCIAGAAVSGSIADRIGRRWTLFSAGIIFIVGAFVSALAPNETVLLVGRDGMVSFTERVFSGGSWEEKRHEMDLRLPVGRRRA